MVVSDEGYGGHVTELDFEKVFDASSHKIVFTQRNPVVRWLGNWPLTNQKSEMGDNGSVGGSGGGEGGDGWQEAVVGSERVVALSEHRASASPFVLHHEHL